MFHVQQEISETSQTEFNAFLSQSTQLTVDTRLFTRSLHRIILSVSVPSLLVTRLVVVVVYSYLAVFGFYYAP
jgi:hypothetical protein